MLLLLRILVACTAAPASNPCADGYVRQATGECVWDDSPAETDTAPDTGDAPAAPQDVVVIVLDTGRWGLFEPGTMPLLIDRVDAGVSVANMTSVAAWTRPTTASLMSGVRWEEYGTGLAESIPEGVPTLSVLARAAGYATYLNSANEALGLPDYQRAFDKVNMVPQQTGLETQGEMALTFFAESDGPALAWIQAMELHIPYANLDERCAADVAAANVGCPFDVTAGAGTLGPFDELSTAEIEACGTAIEVAQRCTATRLDVELDGFLTALGPDPLVVIVTDHGEGWLDPQADHNWGLTQKLTRGFFLMLNSGMEPQVVPLASQVDVLPTILRELEIDDSALSLEGVPLGSPMTALPTAWYCGGFEQFEIAVWEGDRQVIWADRVGRVTTQLFDTRNDPEGDVDLYVTGERPSATLSAALDEKIARTAAVCTW